MAGRSHIRVSAPVATAKKQFTKQVFSRQDGASHQAMRLRQAFGASCMFSEAEFVQEEEGAIALNVVWAVLAAHGMLPMTFSVDSRNTA
jgi:hypothetical protein